MTTLDHMTTYRKFGHIPNTLAIDKLPSGGYYAVCCGHRFEGQTVDYVKHLLFDHDDAKVEVIDENPPPGG